MKKKILIWGTGYVACEVMKNCRNLELYEIEGVIDNNEDKEGKDFFGYKIFLPQILDDVEADTIVVLTDFVDEIKMQIEREYSKRFIVEDKNFFYKESLLRRYSNCNDNEILDVVNYIKNRGLKVFNYEFTEKYEQRKNEILFDSDVGLYYVIYSGKKMYFSRKFKSEQQVNKYYNSILLEQEDDSPHSYFSKGYLVKNGDVVVDCGVAEGNFALDVIDKVSKIYLLETDCDWIEALKYTFKDYADKVEIIPAFVSSYIEGSTYTLDSIIKEPVNYIKMDIEGYEWDALNGAKHLIEISDNIRLAICCYHGDFDQELVESFMDRNGIEHETSNGYMWYWAKNRQTYVTNRLNRGIVFGKKSI